MENKTQTEQKEMEITLENWTELTDEQQQELKSSLIKSKYGIGGEHLSTFPTTMDTKVNEWVEAEYQISKLPKRVTAQTFKEWEANGTVQILPLEVGNTIQYLTIIKPEKALKMDIWELQNGLEKPYTKYTAHNKLEKPLTFSKGHYHITNIYTNKNKAYNQGKALAKLFKLGGNTFKELEAQKELQSNYLRKTLTADGKIILQEIGKNTGSSTGKEWNTLEDYLGRKQHKGITLDYLEHIQ
jgi:hypothetical protein